jgi:NADPH-dependent curcumin reductase CurA
MCRLCNGILTPIVYGSIFDDVLLGMHKSGQIILAGQIERYAEAPRSYCTYCQKPSSVEVPIDNVLQSNDF